MSTASMNRRLKDLENHNGGIKVFLISDEYTEEEQRKECELFKSSVPSGERCIFIIDEFGENSRRIADRVGR
ncbi:MAG: hypothetical protein A4E71_02553 [Smithella sp. PtaU1.Bin162]|nr:MAG: hypothetical protein A4E71_02553 [Smithella sp. PtaU1.Bin162]